MHPATETTAVTSNKCSSQKQAARQASPAQELLHPRNSQGSIEPDRRPSGRLFFCCPLLRSSQRLHKSGHTHSVTDRFPCSPRTKSNISCTPSKPALSPRPTFITASTSSSHFGLRRTMNLTKPSA